MPNDVYVAAQDDNQLSVFTIDGETGRLTHIPSSLVVTP